MSKENIPLGLNNSLQQLDSVWKTNQYLERILSRHFFEAPFLQFCLPEDDKRRAFLQSFVPKFVSHAFKVCHVSGAFPKSNPTELVGVSILFGSDARASITKALKGFDVSKKFGSQASNRITRLQATLKDANKRIMQNKIHWRFMYPHPSLFRDGVRDDMIRLVNNSASNIQMPVYIEVYSEDDVEWYKNWGYTCFGEFSTPVEKNDSATLKFWVLIRWPRPDSPEEGLKQGATVYGGIPEKTSSSTQERKSWSPTASTVSTASNYGKSPENEDHPFYKNRGSPVQTQKMESSPKAEERVERGSWGPTKSPDKLDTSGYGVPIRPDKEKLSKSEITKRERTKTDGSFIKELRDLRMSDDISNMHEIDYDELELGSTLHAGSNTIVRKGTWRLQEIVFKKWTSVTPKDIQREAKIVTRLRPHKNIISTFGVCINPEKPAGIVCEYLELGSLKDFLLKDKVPLRQKVSLSIDIASGLKHLHYEKLVHRNLCAANILLKEGKKGVMAVISSFSLSRHVGSNQKGQTITEIGPVKYMSPESLSRKEYSLSSDIWMYGCTLVEIFSDGKEPYEEMPAVQVIGGVMSGKLKPPIAPATPTNITSLIDSCFAFKPEERPDIREISKNWDKIEDDL